MIGTARMMWMRVTTKEENQRELIKRASLAGPQALKQEDSPLCNTT